MHSVILQAECGFYTHESKFDTYASEYDIHECDFYTHEYDFYTQSLIPTRSVISTGTNVIRIDLVLMKQINFAIVKIECFTDHKPKHD
jgi:hypothetical protein